MTKSWGKQRLKGLKQYRSKGLATPLQKVILIEWSQEGWLFTSANWNKMEGRQVLIVLWNRWHWTKTVGSIIALTMTAANVCEYLVEIDRYIRSRTVLCNSLSMNHDPLFIYWHTYNPVTWRLVTFLFDSWFFWWCFLLSFCASEACTETKGPPKFESCFLKWRRDQVSINYFAKGSSIPKEATSSGLRLPCKRSSMLWVLSWDS